MIQTLPERARCEYGDLIVDSVVCYPKSFVAESPGEFDQLHRRLQDDGALWTADLDLEGYRLVENIKLDQRYVTLKFPVGDYVRRYEEFRQDLLAADTEAAAAKS